MLDFVLLLAALIAAGKGADAGLDRVQVTLGGDPPVAASFSIAPSGREGAWRASTPDGCRFGLEIGSAKGPWGKGAFVREKAVSCGPFLSRVAAALEGKKVARAARVDRVDFDLAVLGTDLRRGANGDGFSGKGGGWTATKLFLDGGNAEVYLNFNPGTGEAELSQKDADYGEDVLRILASVLGGS